ncbi:hypothetical protein [Flammeovirga agarivorans]|uniref:Uncharacterized protein n=1 Tax=Flammeovirga agarivorans TaxID=2726742 RepID=A0A7X8XY52_9BACT|nr:hypothetical protein [Flammeovirga agarivorans]NLR93886.1 hypothetical protein [Flammeovirga agarivorans]
MKRLLQIISLVAALSMMSCAQESSEGCCKQESCANCEKCSSGDKSECKMGKEEAAMHKCCKEKVANGEKACCTKTS